MMLNLKGKLDHDYGVVGVEYSIDGGEWIRVSDNGKFDLSILIDYSKRSTHILTIRGVADYDGNDSARKSNRCFLGSVIYITVT